MSVIPTGVLQRTIGLVVVLVLLGACLSFNVRKAALPPSPTPVLDHPSMALMWPLLEKSDLPPNDWKLSIGPDEWPEYHGQDDGVYVGFNTDAYNVPIVHIVLRYRNDSYAAEGFDRSIQAHFHSAGLLTNWERPAQLNLESEIANRFQLACADFQSIGDNKINYTDCVAVARYQKYISILGANITDHYEGALSYSEFENVLKAIDKRMQAYLDVVDGNQPKNE